VSEIKSLSPPEEKWFWMPTDCNLADLGTRPNVEPGDLAEDSYCQNGQPWMMKPESEWPTKKQFSAPPAEERRKDVVTVASALSATAPGTKFRSLAKLVNTYPYVFQAIKRWKTYRVDPVRMEQRLEPPLPEAVEAATLYLIQDPKKKSI
jgi:hypothetical protein